ncbi:nucleotide exchange factor GrpE [Buchnera aphidicola]|uniref:nucleotide exchange factor GrpE n=1 Tax=Buchnera aphidicola TaxID=9 RepID=UPI00346465F7
MKKNKENVITDEKENVITDEKENVITDEKENVITDEKENVITDEKENVITDEKENVITDEKENVITDEIVELEEKIKNIENKIKEIRLRSQAEIINIKNKAKKNVKNIKNIIFEKFIKKIINFLDVFEKTINYFTEKNNNTLKYKTEGILLIYKSLIDNIIKLGVQIENKKNVIYNKNIHKPILFSKSKIIPNNFIINVIKKGYIIKNKVIRKAHVEVSMNKNYSDNK